MIELRNPRCIPNFCFFTKMHVTLSPQNYTFLSPPPFLISSDSVMGCGASALGPEDGSNNPLHYKFVRPINERHPKAAPPLHKNDDVFSFRVKMANHEKVGVEERKKLGHVKPPSIDVVAQSEAHPVERDDAFTGTASPSFREYCVHLRSSSNIELSDYDDSDNMGNDDPIIGKSKPPRKEITNPKKEAEKKETKGRKLRDVINKGRSGGRKMNIVRRRPGSRVEKPT